MYLYIYEYVWIGELLDVSGLMGVGRGSWERGWGEGGGEGGWGEGGWGDGSGEMEVGRREWGDWSAGRRLYDAGGVEMGVWRRECLEVCGEKALPIFTFLSPPPLPTPISPPTSPHTHFPTLISPPSSPHPPRPTPISPPPSPHTHRPTPIQSWEFAHRSFALISLKSNERL